MKLRKPTVENISKYKVYNSSIFNKLKRKMKNNYFKTYLKKIKATLKSAGKC